MDYDLKRIKDKYGEDFMHLCRSLFSSILEKGELFNLIESKFAYNKSLYEDIVNNNLKTDFKNYVYCMFKGEKIEKADTNKSVKELLSEVGYELYECKTEEDIQSFRKYYIKDEELCTFNGNRLKSCYVFFAVKKNVNDIKRENFKQPKREDLYGTSVISIQFTRDETNTLSIKNRYNHKVVNPDSTFSNNLENIIPGLTCAFEKEYNLNITQASSKDFGLLDYNYVERMGKLYKYNYEINNIYYCPNNLIITNDKMIQFDNSKFLLIDYFILDLQSKALYLYDKKIRDSFPNTIQEIQSIKIFKDKIKKKKTIEIKTNFNEITIKINKLNQMIEYIDKNSKIIEDDYLYNNGYLKSINLFSAEMIGNNFIYCNEILEEVNLPKAIKICSSFIYWNKKLKKINLPNVEYIDDYFLIHNEDLYNLSLPQVRIINLGFLRCNKLLKKLYTPNLVSIDDYYLVENNEKDKLLNKEKVLRR